MEKCKPHVLLLSFLFVFASFTTAKIRVSEAIFNDINHDATSHEDDLIPAALVGQGSVTKKDIPGLPLDPDDFKKAAEMKIVNAPPINGDDPIMAAKQFQGDIIIQNPEILDILNQNGAKNMPPKNAIKEDYLKWPNGVIPYAISASYDATERAVIAKAMAEFHKYTCIRFRPRDKDQDYIFIKKGVGCSSAVGRVGGEQAVSLGGGCVYHGIAIHELMHAAGFWHEQSRNDRNNYVTIIWNNIQRGMDYNFHKYGWDIIQDLGVSYDTGSIMHYGAYSFAIDRSKPTIVANDRSEIGQRSDFSSKDKQKLNKLYQCSSTVIEPVTQAPVGPGEICANSNEHCDYWKSISECEKNPAWMHNNCKKSCAKCKEEDSCKNDNANCVKWASEGHCHKSVGYMTKHCKKSCKSCNGVTPTNSCEDENEYCGDWHKAGECRANPTYMLTYCKKSCNTC